MNHDLFTAFEGYTHLAHGALRDVAAAVKDRLDSGDSDAIRLYDDATGTAIDIDWSGTLEDVLERLKSHPVLGPGLAPPPPQQPGPGRPRLGVVSREVSLLPRHWAWLAEQRGGASAALRRLVDEARKRSKGDDDIRRAMEAAHRFMWDIGGNLPDFEEASRAFFARDFAALPDRLASWPADVREHLLELVARIPQKS